ncbi:chalcone isomerase, partial [Lentinula aciculospora]
VVDSATGIRFPKTIRVASKVPLPTLSLVGVGVRTVSFLRIQVYSVGFYADLNNANLKFEPTMTPDDKIREIVNTCACEIRIVPTRNTSYSHLRDAFIRAITARLRDGRKNGTTTEEEAVEAASPIRKLKTLFPNTALTKHSPLDIFLYPPTPGKPRALTFRDLGSVESDWVAREFVLHYFDGDGPSPALKKMVVETVETL